MGCSNGGGRCVYRNVQEHVQNAEGHPTVNWKISLPSGLIISEHFKTGYRLSDVMNKCPRDVVTASSIIVLGFVPQAAL